MKIVFNGLEYDGVEQMPPEIRNQYLRLIGTLGDANGNGVPDVALAFWNQARRSVAAMMNWQSCLTKLRLIPTSGRAR